MATTPQRHRHLQIFGVCLGGLLAALAFFLFGVRIEQAVPGVGRVVSAESQAVGSPMPGRLLAIPGLPLEAGSVVPPGAVLFEVETSGARNPVAAPRDSPGSWLLERLHARPGEAVQAGQQLLSLVPVRGQEGELRAAWVRAEFAERHFAGLRVGQPVRIRSRMYPPRAHGTASGVIRELLPAGQAAGGEEVLFAARIEVTDSPYPLRLGSAVEVEVILGRNETFRVILER